mgnify:CR=1 FL=1
MNSKPELYFGIDQEDFSLEIGGKNFIIDEALTYKIIENIKKNVWLKLCKNCEKPFIRNSSTHKICWRCKGKSGDVEL